MFITKKHLSRRTLLRGTGATLALPFLDAMVPAGTALAQTAAMGAPRFVGVFSAHGWSPTYWQDGRPEVAPTEGRNIGLGFVHAPLKPFEDQLTLCAGLDATSSMPPPGTSGGDHARAAAALTGAPPKKTGGPDIQCGVSVDQLIAQKYGQETLLPSIQLGIEDPGSNTGVCGWGYSCAYSNSISWAGPNKPLPHEVNPLVVFERLFGDGATPAERQSRRLANKSILDAVTGKINQLQKQLPASDKVRMESYLENVREVERRLQIATRSTSAAPDMDMPFAPPQSIDAHIKLMWDLQVLAFQADITRVSALLFCRDESGTSYPESGVTTANHSASHHGEDKKRREDWAKINRYHMTTFAYFLDKLRSTPDGERNLLDNSLVLWTSNMGNANQHSHVNVGQLIVGGAMGRHKPARLNLMETGPTSNFLLSVLHLYGIEQASIGDSTQAVSLT
ncbi:MAG: DUF1552 domain-containing protein [Pseudohongiellaceae bacterium]|jgi:hypothetical protein